MIYRYPVLYQVPFVSKAPVESNQPAFSCILI